jgi:hypothetical protein
MLNMYGLERDTAERQYADLMNQQRGVAYATIRQQLMDRMAQELPKLAGTPGMLDYMAHSSYAPLLGSPDPQSLGSLIGASNRQQGITNLKTLLEAGKAGAEGGYNVSPDIMSQLTNLPVSSMTPISTTNSIINAQGRILQGQNRQGPHMMVTIETGGLNPDGTPEKVQVPVTIGAPPEVQQAELDEGRRIAKMPNAGRPNVPGAPTDPRANANAPPGTGVSTPGTDARVADPNNPLLGGLGGDGQPTPVTQTGLRPAPAGLTYAPRDTGGGSGTVTTPAAAAPAQPVAQPSRTAPAQPAAATPARLPDTPIGKIEDWQTPAGRALQGRARQGLSTLSQDDRSDVVAQAARLGGNVAIRVLNGTPMYINSKGQPVGPVP